MSYKIIRQAIYDKLQADATKPGAIYAHPESTIEAFPAVVVNAVSDTVENITTGARNRKINYIFEIIGYYPFNDGESQKDSTGALDEVADELNELFGRTDALVVQGIKRVHAEKGQMEYFQGDEGNYQMFVMELKIPMVKECMV